MAVVNKIIISKSGAWAGNLETVGNWASDGHRAITTDTKEWCYKMGGAIYRASRRDQVMLLDGTQAMTGNIDLDGWNIILDQDGDSKFVCSRVAGDDVLNLVLNSNTIVEFSETLLGVNARQKFTIANTSIDNYTDGSSFLTLYNTDTTTDNMAGIRFTTKDASNVEQMGGGIYARFRARGTNGFSTTYEAYVSLYNIEVQVQMLYFAFSYTYSEFKLQNASLRLNDRLIYAGDSSDAKGAVFGNLKSIESTANEGGFGISGGADSDGDYIFYSKTFLSSIPSTKITGVGSIRHASFINNSATNSNMILNIIGGTAGAKTGLNIQTRTSEALQTGLTWDEPNQTATIWEEGTGRIFIKDTLIGISQSVPKGYLHVKAGSGSTSVTFASTNLLVLEHTDSAYDADILLISHNTRDNGLYFGNESNSKKAWIRADEDKAVLYLGTIYDLVKITQQIFMWRYSNSSWATSGQLHTICSDFTNSNVFYSAVAHSGGQAGLYMGDFEAETAGAIKYLNSDNSLRISVNSHSTADLFIKSDGFIGINNQAPTSNLHINGSQAYSTTQVSANLVLDATHNIILWTKTTDGTLTLPEASTCIGRKYIVLFLSTGGTGCYLVRSGSDLINGSSDSVSCATLYNHYEIIAGTSGNWYVKGF